MSYGRVFALDLATTTGWAVGEPGSAPRCGSHRLAKEGATNGALFLALAKWLGDFCTIEQPRALMIEAPMNARTQVSIGSTEATAHRLIGLVGIAEMVAEARGIWTVRTANVQDVRKHFVGQARFKAKLDGKRAVAERCRLMGWSVPDLDAADAAALWDFGCSIFAPRQHAQGASAMGALGRGAA